MSGTKRINFDKPTGLNGSTHAIDLSQRNGTVSIIALDKKLTPRALVEVPTVDLGELIQSLEVLQEEAENGK